MDKYKQKDMRCEILDMPARTERYVRAGVVQGVGMLAPIPTFPPKAEGLFVVRPKSGF